MFYAGEPIAVRVRPSRSDVLLEVTLWRTGASQPVAAKPLQVAGDDWHVVEFLPPGAGAYRVSVSGPNVETAEDSCAVAELAAQDVGAEIP